MHHRLSELLGVEVIGELALEGDTFVDDGRGRICLERLDDSLIRPLVKKLHASYPQGLRIADRLHRRDDKEPVWGVVDVQIPLGPNEGHYLLEISHTSVFELFERRFVLDPEDDQEGPARDSEGEGTDEGHAPTADLRGILCEAAWPLVSGVEHPLRVISGFDELFADYRAQLESVLKAARGGECTDCQDWLDAFSRRLVGLWRLIPWKLRQSVNPRYGRRRAQTAPFDPLLDGLLFIGVNLVEGTLPTRYVQVINPTMDYAITRDTVATVYTSMQRVYRPPVYTTAAGRASSIEAFIAAFPRYKSLVGEVNLEDTLHLG